MSCTEISTQSSASVPNNRAKSASTRLISQPIVHFARTSFLFSPNRLSSTSLWIFAISPSTSRNISSTQSSGAKTKFVNRATLSTPIRWSAAATVGEARIGERLVRSLERS